MRYALILIILCCACAYEATKDFKARLSWQSDSTKKQIIPTEQLYLP